jgi:hypothetical protein
MESSGLFRVASGRFLVFMVIQASGAGVGAGFAAERARSKLNIVGALRKGLVVWSRWKVVEGERGVRCRGSGSGLQVPGSWF